MRLTQYAPVVLESVDASRVNLTGPRGEKAIISVLDADLLRVQYLPEGVPRLDRTWAVVGADGDVPREGRLRDDLSPFRTPGFVHQLDDDGNLTLSTDQLTITARLSDLRLEWKTADGINFACDAPTRAYAYDRAGRGVFHYMHRRADEHYYGFGERAGDLDKAGAHMTMKNLDSLGYDARTGDPLYKHWPFYITFVPELDIAYGLFYDNFATTTFDMGRERDAYHGFYRYYHAEDGDIDYTMIFGPTIPDVVRKIAKLTGYMQLPPRWSLGYLGSTMLYTDMPDAGERLKDFVDLCQQHDIPCDLFHLSSGYTTGEEDGRRYVFNWNRKKVPQPETIVNHFRDNGVHLSANIKPYFVVTHPFYEEVKDKLIQAAEHDAPEHITLWAGGVFETDDGGYMDFTNPAGYKWWQDKVTEALLKYGIDSTWNDNNEFQVWDDEARCHGFGQETRVSLLRPVQTLLMTRASYEAQRAFAPDLRPFVLCRSGMPGIQRYAQTWSGDNTTSWETLRYNIPMGLGMSLSGAPNTGHDVGGFFGPKPDAELFVRWVQNGIFHPRFTIHSFNTDGTVNEPWMYPEVLPIIRDAIKFRYRLIPYLYMLMFEAAEFGHPIIRPMVYEFPHDERCRTESFDFMLGDALLVPSVLELGARVSEASICQRVRVGMTSIQATITTVVRRSPLMRHWTEFRFLRGRGPSFRWAKRCRHVGAAADDLRQILLFPYKDGGIGRGLLIEDDGVSLPHTYTRVDLAIEMYNRR